MAHITEITDDSNGGDEYKKPEELVKKPKEEEESQNEKPKEEDEENQNENQKEEQEEDQNENQKEEQEENQNENQKEEEEESQNEKPKQEEEEKNQNQKPKQEEDRSSFPIPGELTEICIALVRRCHYPMVAQVSNYFRRLIASSSLYKTRSRLDLTELVLYASFRFPHYESPRLYILNRNKFLLLDSLPEVPLGSAVVTIGTNMYVIGGRRVGQETTSDVILIDCRTHKCRSLPSMQRARYRADAGVIDGKIHVIGGCEKRSSDSSWIQVLDVEKEIWNAVPGPYPYTSLRGEFVTYVVMEEKLYIWDPACCLVYEPKRRSRWTSWVGEGHPVRSLWQESCCVIDDMLYNIDPLRSLGFPIVAYDPKDETWRPVKNVAFGYCPIKLPLYHIYYESKMTNFGGKLVILGGHKSRVLITDSGENVICCVTIALERREGGEIWGEVESVDHVFSSEPNMPAPATEFARTLAF